MLKTKMYEDHKKLLFKLAWICSSKTGIDVEDLISEFNIVFCEAFDTFDIDGDALFSTYFYKCCLNRLSNLLISLDRKKRKFILFTDIDICALSHDPLDSVIVYDNFVNNPNPVIRKIARIVSIYSLPRTSMKPWLRRILLKTFNIEEITVAFDQLHTLYEM